MQRTMILGSMAQPPPPLPPMHSQISSPLAPSVPAPSHPILDELREKNNYNPTEYDLSAKGGRFFVIKSYSEDDIHRFAPSIVQVINCRLRVSLFQVDKVRNMV